MRVLKTYTQRMATPLTGEELRDRAKQLADTVQEIGSEEEQQENTRDMMKAKLSELKARQTGLAIVVATGKEYRNVEVVIHLIDAGQIQEVRLDTAEIISTRPPYDSERQLLLDEKE